MKGTEVGPLGWKWLQRAQIHFPYIALTTSIATASSTNQHSVKPTGERALLSPQPRHRESASQQMLPLGSCLELGARAPASPVAVTSFACTLACTELVRLIRGAPHGQLAGISASFNSQSSREPGEGLSAFTEMKGRHGEQSWTLGAVRAQ